MKLLPVLLLISFTSPAQTKLYSFIGQYREYDYADGYFWFTFIGTSGKVKEFIRLDVWDTLNYDLTRLNLYRDQWFEISYYGVYDGLGDDEEKRWFRRMKSIKMIPPPKLYTFIGKFKSASSLEGSGYYTFTGLNGKEKKFAHDIEWSGQLPYNLLDDLADANESYVDKWFRITYYGVYKALSGDDDGVKSWHRKIYSIKMIPKPKSQNGLFEGTGRLVNFSTQNGIAEFSFDENFHIQDGIDDRTVESQYNSTIQVTCDKTTLEKFVFDFRDERAFAEKYYEHRFKFQYRIEYALETKEPVTRKILSLEILE